jgi:hypothetical protein
MPDKAGLLRSRCARASQRRGWWIRLDCLTAHIACWLLAKTVAGDCLTLAVLAPRKDGVGGIASLSLCSRLAKTGVVDKAGLPHCPHCVLAPRKDGGGGLLRSRCARASQRRCWGIASLSLRSRLAKTMVLNYNSECLFYEA